MNILVIGNGPSAAKGNLGKLIDNFDGLVARFNMCVICEEVGFRTDIWATWGELGKWRDINQSQTLVTVPREREKIHKDTREFMSNYGDRDDVSQVTMKTWRGVRRHIGHPSAGAIAVAHFLRSPDIDDVKIFGFDHFREKKHHYWSHDEFERHGHDPYRESQWFKNLKKQKRISEWTPKNE